jgi:hypothetical protein
VRGGRRPVVHDRIMGRLKCIVPICVDEAATTCSTVSPIAPVSWCGNSSRELVAVEVAVMVRGRSAPPSPCADDFVPRIVAFTVCASWPVRYGICTDPSMHVTLLPPTQTVSSVEMWMRPARPIAVPWAAR